MTEPDHVWRQLAELLRSAQDSVILVAPFIKKSVLEAALNAIPRSVGKIDCVTRWTPAEVASGVSDPEIISLAENDSRIRVRLCPSLHAKIYVADGRCMVGSANLTGRGTGHAVESSNVELLVEVKTGRPEVQRVLEQLGAVAIGATKQMAELVRQQADALLDTSIAPRAQVACWYPVTRRPEKIYAYYRGRAGFGPAVEEGMIRDLALLDIPVGLTEDKFDIEIRSRLHAVPELSRLRNGEKLSNLELQSALMGQRAFTENEARRATETIAAWLKHFDNFYLEVGSWALRQGREIPP